MTIAFHRTEADGTDPLGEGREALVSPDPLGMSFEEALEVLAATETPRRATDSAA